MIIMDKNTKIWLGLNLTMSQRNKPQDQTQLVLVDVDGHVTEGPGFNVGIVKTKSYTQQIKMF